MKGMKNVVYHFLLSEGYNSERIQCFIQHLEEHVKDVFLHWILYEKSCYIVTTECCIDVENYYREQNSYSVINLLAVIDKFNTGKRRPLPASHFMDWAKKYDINNKGLYYFPEAEFCGIENLIYKCWENVS